MADQEQTAQAIADPALVYRMQEILNRHRPLLPVTQAVQPGHPYAGFAAAELQRYISSKTAQNTCWPFCICIFQRNERI